MNRDEQFYVLREYDHIEEVPSAARLCASGQDRSITAMVPIAMRRVRLDRIIADVATELVDLLAEVASEGGEPTVHVEVQRVLARLVALAHTDTPLPLPSTLPTMD